MRYGGSSCWDVEGVTGGIWDLELLGYGRDDWWGMEARAVGIWKGSLMGYGSSTCRNMDGIIRI